MDAITQARAEQLAKDFASQARTAEDLNGLLQLMMKTGLERMLNTELDVHLGRRGQTSAAPPAAMMEESATSVLLPAKRSPNRRNGHSKKTVAGDLGEVTIATPRSSAAAMTSPSCLGCFGRALICEKPRCFRSLPMLRS